MVCRAFLLLFSCLASLAIPSWTYAQDQHFSVEGANFTLDVPSSWQSAPGLLGMPYAALGEEDSGGRPVLAIVPTPLTKISFDDRELEKTQSDYASGRKEWLDERGGEAIEFFPYKKFKSKAGIEIRSIGYRYKLAGVEFKEVSYFLSCKERLFQLQSLLRAQQKPAVQTTIDSMIGSFRCE